MLFGVDDGTRTHDDWNHNPGLYQLSYAHHCNRAHPSITRVGAPGRTRTCNPRLRRPMLCPVELRALQSPQSSLSGCIPPPQRLRPTRSSAGHRETGRGGGIRTPDFLLPKQARYQAALHPVGPAATRRAQGPRPTEGVNDTHGPSQRQSLRTGWDFTQNSGPVVPPDSPCENPPPLR